MIILALLILLAIVCTYGWLAYRIKTTRPDGMPVDADTLRKIQGCKGFTAADAHAAFAGVRRKPATEIMVTVPKPYEPDTPN